MRVVCECGREFDSPISAGDCPRCLRRSARRLTLIVLALILVLIAGFKLGHAWIAYGDWRCAFAECRIEVPSRQGVPSS